MIPRDLANRLLADILQAARDRGIRIKTEDVGRMPEGQVGILVIMTETEEEYRKRMTHRGIAPTA